MATDTDTQTLRVVQEHEERNRDQAAQALRDALAAEAQGLEQAESLANYRHDHVKRWQQRFRDEACTPQLLTHYASFTQRLDAAIEQQAAVVLRLQATTERRREALVAAETRVAAIGKLIARRVGEARRAEERRDQKTNDEAAQRTRRTMDATLTRPGTFQ